MEGQYPINDIVSISDPMCLQRGYALYYKGYLTTSNLEANELYAVSAALYTHGIHENTTDGAVIQRIYVDNNNEHAAGEAGGKGKKKVLAVLVKYGSFVLAQVLYVVNKPFGQFDPLYIQKSKYCILV